MEAASFSSSSPLPSFSPFTPSPLAASDCQQPNSSDVSAFLVPALSVEFSLGLLGNSLALFIFGVHTRPWTSNTVFLVSLVMADFLLIINLPFRVHFYLHQQTWLWDAGACRLNLFMLSTNRTASLLFLTAIALNRYLKVVRPHHALSRASAWAAARVAAGLWACILLLNMHVFWLPYSNNSCLSFQPLRNAPLASRWHQALYLLEFFLPLMIFLFTIVSIRLTIRRRGLGQQAGPRRALRVLAAVVTVYTVCFLPSIVLGLVILAALRLRACSTVHTCALLFHGAVAFTYLNSVLDPVLYCFSSPSFLRQGKALLGCAQAGQGPDDDHENTHPPPARRPTGRREAEVAGKLTDVFLDFRRPFSGLGSAKRVKVTPLDCPQHRASPPPGPEISARSQVGGRETTDLGLTE